ncbi:hypothetical protein [Atlantibacter hermannii]|uniref:hypothetical protein n=1 Tax=Atlantibacter hermannii TaxID=565 RepID=UPI0028A73C0E|nr:hypothetical protein [Atlantibacter hermannii]
MASGAGIKIIKGKGIEISENFISGYENGIVIDDLDGGKISANKILHADAKVILQDIIELIKVNADEANKKIAPSADQDITNGIIRSCTEGKRSLLEKIESLATICAGTVTFWPPLYELLTKLCQSL